MKSIWVCATCVLAPIRSCVVFCPCAYDFIFVKVEFHPLLASSDIPQLPHTHNPPPPPIRRPNLADFAELVCRIVGFLNLADLFCRITRFLGLCRLVLPTCWGFWVLGHLRWSCSLSAFAGWVQCQRNVLLLLFIFMSFFWVTPARNGPGFFKNVVIPINAAWIFRKCTAFPCT